MEFRRSGQRDERRRRVLIEDAKNERLANDATSEATSKRSGPKGGASYAEGARADRQPRITDMIPTRLWTLLVVGLLGATAIAALESAYVAVYLQLDRSLAEGARGLDLTGPHSLARWFSAGMFALAAGYALLIFTLRRHRVDDYRGRYRIWIPTAMFLLLASMETIAGMRHLLGLWIDREVSLSLPHQPTIWWVIVVLALGSLLLTRLLIEMRRSRLATGCALLVVAFHGGATMLWSGLVELPDEAEVMAQQGLLLGGNFLVLYTLLIYARHVFLDAQGRIPPRATPRRSWFSGGAGVEKAARSSAAAKSSRTKATPANSRRKSKATSTGKSIRVDSSHDDETQDAKSSANAGSSTASSRTSGGRTSTAKSSNSSGTTSAAASQAGGGNRAAPKSNRAGSAGQGEDDEGGETLTDVYIDPETGAERKLSKAERRKMRKESRRHQRI